MNRPVLALSLARLGDGIGNSVLIVLVPLYVAALPSPSMPLPESVLVGILISLFGLVNATAQPVFASLVDRWGHRKVFIQAGLAVMALGTLSFLAAGRYLDLLVIRAVQGVGFALTIPASMAIMAQVTEMRTRGGAMGVFATFRMAGFATGPLLGGWVHVTWGFDAAFLVGTAFIALGMVAVQAWLDQEAEPEAGVPARARGWLDPGMLSGGILGLGVAMFVMAADVSMMSTLENEFNARLDQTALGFGVAFSALTFSRLVVQVPLGALSDRIGRKPLVVVGLAAMGPFTALLGWAASTLQLTGVRVLQGVASAAVAAPAFALGADLSRKGGEGRQLSVLTMGFGLGIALGPLLAGFLAVLSFQLPFVVGGLLSVAASGVVQRFVPRSLEGS